MLEDIALEKKTNATEDEDLKLLQQCLEECATALHYDGRQFYSQLYNNLQKVFNDSSDSASEITKYSFMKTLFDICSKPPVLSLLPVAQCSTPDQEEPLPPPSTLSPDAAADESHSTVTSPPYFDSICRLYENPCFVVTVSTEKEEVAVWDIRTMKAVRTLQGVVYPLNLQLIDDIRCVVLCKRELRIYNLDDGEFVTKLKGVMNQKMPYYGLHNAEHIVALSRNRMYVNLMNLQTGDCVTTFKVGEDRFLNSLIVSENGKILVCGDETQKPFPLLVWDLTLRKLLYDLRIPHHDFVTKLAAITSEGHYVCCVCKVCVCECFCAHVTSDALQDVLLECKFVDFFLVNYFRNL